MSGTTARNHPPSRTASARARLRSKSQLTLPDEIRRALRVNEGDVVEFIFQEDGTITLRGYISVPTDHAWLYAVHQSAPGTSDRGFVGSQATAHEYGDAMFSHLDALGAADA